MVKKIITQTFEAICKARHPHWNKVIFEIAGFPKQEKQFEALEFIGRNQKQASTQKFMEVLKEFKTSEETISDLYYIKAPVIPIVYCPKCTRRGFKIEGQFYLCRDCDINFFSNGKIAREGNNGNKRYTTK